MDGQQWNKEEFKKDQIIKMEMSVMFTRQMFVQIEARYSNDIFVILPFHVNGGFRESSEVENLRKNIKNQKEWAEKSRSEMYLDHLPVIYGTMQNKASKQNVLTLTKYEKSVLKETQKHNVKLFKKLKKNMILLIQLL